MSQVSQICCLNKQILSLSWHELPSFNLIFGKLMDCHIFQVQYMDIVCTKIFQFFKTRQSVLSTANGMGSVNMYVRFSSEA